MKNIKSILLTGLTLLAGASFVSCTEEEFQPGPEASGVQVFFPEATQTDYSLDDNMTSVTIPVKRANTEGEYTVSVLPDFSQNETDPTSLFTIPESVTFADGEDETSLVVSFKRADMEDGATYTVNLLLNDAENTTPYGYSQLSLTLTPWPWTLLGTGSYRDDWMSNFFSPNYVEIEVNIHEHKTNKGVYMVEEMLGWPFMTEFFEATQADLSGQFSYTPSNIVVDCSDPNNVVIEQQYSGITENTYGYGNFYIFSDAAGTLENGVITFPESGIIIACDGASEDAGAYYANGSGMFRILLPGAVITDYSLAAEYSGMRVASDNETASAVIDFTYGADVAGITYLFAAGDVTSSVDSYIAAITDGTAENTSTLENLAESNGTATVSAEAALQAGRYTLIAVPSDASGAFQAEDAAVCVFYFPGMSGGTIPECDIKVAMYPVSEYENAAEDASEYPDYSSLVYEITGSEISDLKMAFLPTSTLNSALWLDFTLEEVLASVGSDMSEVLADLNSGTPVWDIFAGLDAATSYTLIASATNDYGKSATVSCELTTGEVPYDGTLVTGPYMMTCTIPEGSSDGSDFVSQNLFRISPKPDSQTSFVVSDLGFENGLSWNAVYDETAGTLTLDGTFPGQEDRGSFFGGYVTNDNISATALATYADGSEAMDDPVVFKVNASGEVESLNTNIEVVLALIVEGSVSPLGAVGVFYTGDTTVEPYRPGAETSAVSSLSVSPMSGFMFNGTADMFLRHVSVAEPAGLYQARSADRLATVATTGSKCAVPRFRKMRHTGFR